MTVLTIQHYANLCITQLPWAEVKKEMTEEKGLDGAVADKIGEYVKHKGRPAVSREFVLTDTTPRRSLIARYTPQR